MPLLTFVLLPWVKKPWFIAPVPSSNSAALYRQTTDSDPWLSYLPLLLTKDPCGLHWSHLDNPGPCQGQLISNLNSICNVNSPSPWNLPDPQIWGLFCRTDHPSYFIPWLFLVRRDLFLLEEMFHMDRKDYSVVGLFLIALSISRPGRAFLFQR